MNTRISITRTVVLFIALAVAGVVVAISAQFVMTSLEQTIMVALGSAIFGSALTFFLLRLFTLVEK